MKQIFHHYEKWEDWKCGFYDSMFGKEKQCALEIVVDVFSDSQLTNELMQNVIDKWKYSCEQNLSNSSMNKIAWLGQACLSLEFNIPQTITMSAWENVPENFKEQANKIASDIIEKWEINYE